MTRKEELCKFYGVNVAHYEKLWTMIQSHYDSKKTFTEIMEEIKKKESISKKEFDLMGAVVYGLRTVDNIMKMSNMKMKTKNLPIQ